MSSEKSKSSNDIRLRFLFYALVFFPVAFLFTYSLFLPSDREKFVKSEYTGRVKDKYRNKKNHNHYTMVFSRHGQTNGSYILNTDTLFFNLVQVNDSLEKIAGQDIINIYRPDTCFSWKINFR